MARYAATFKFRCTTEDISAEIYMSLYGEYCRDAKTEEIQSKR